MGNGVKLGSSRLWSKLNWVTDSHSSRIVYLIRKWNKFLFMVDSNGQRQQSLLQHSIVAFLSCPCHKLWKTSTSCVQLVFFLFKVCSSSSLELSLAVFRHTHLKEQLVWAASASRISGCVFVPWSEPLRQIHLYLSPWVPTVQAQCCPASSSLWLCWGWAESGLSKCLTVHTVHTDPPKGEPQKSDQRAQFYAMGSIIKRKMEISSCQLYSFKPGRFKSMFQGPLGCLRHFPDLWDWNYFVMI